MSKKFFLFFFFLFLLNIKSYSGLIQPSDLLYLGAFRLPEVEGNFPAIWDWSGQTMTYYPQGDPNGSNDGFPGSLFLTGIDIENWVSEISIPAPLISSNVNNLPFSKTIQPFADVRGGLFSNFTELPRVGIEYMPAQEGQDKGHLYLTWGQHFHDDPNTNIGPTHAWCDLNLSHPNTKGAWWVGTREENENGFIYRVNDYLFAIPDAWANSYSMGRNLGTGRFRDGGWGGLGPNLFAIAPHREGNPPQPGKELPYTTLLKYSSVMDGDNHKMKNYSHSDSWSGGAWINAGSNSAVIFVGTKGSGYTWYGYFTPDGVGPPPHYPEGAPCVYYEEDIMCTRPDGETPCTQEDLAPCLGANVQEESRGWWSSRFDAVILFYNPNDFASVAINKMQPYEPQPYAILDLDNFLYLNAYMEDVVMYNGKGNQRKNRFGAPAYDREHNLLFILELFADEYRPVVHIWKINERERKHSRPFGN